MAIAYCWRSGEIEITEKTLVPVGTVPLLEGEVTRLTEVVSATSRHAYDGKTLLVPGVPEDDSDDEAMSATLRWVLWASQRDGVTRSSAEEEDE